MEEEKGKKRKRSEGCRQREKQRRKEENLTEIWFLCFGSPTFHEEPTVSNVP
jgi:hypothetical protein